ncbi:hypothetical protein C8R45DRAFT_1078572 [Mycena sanguinolenta]|nr:hypothetical protein C8R45DRAFT_1078572 [Mycena sanguinolenta]
MGKKVICTCPECIEHWVTVDGQRIPGARITQQLRRVHELRTAANGSPEYAKPHKSKVRPIGVEEPFDEEDIKVKSSGSPGIVINGLLIVQLCAALIVWLNLKASISNETGNTILKALQFILNTALELLQVVLATQGIKVQLPKFRIPKDLRTIYRNYTQEPEILRTPCCPKCYTLYSSLETMPQRCTAKVSKKSRISCKAELWRTQRFGKESKQVPITTFNTQKFESWMEWFLSRKSTEDYLSQSYQRPAAADGEEMSDLQDSPRWKELKALGDKYNLVFGLYIDWFNPRSNKLAGVKVTARIVPLVADLPAAREAGGFLSYAATMFCSFCLLTKDEKARLDYWAWPKRIAATVRKQAKAWFKQPTKEKRVNMERETGVWGCSLHLLPYRDPVNDTILGFMHNWLLGVLEHQLRVLWGVGRDSRQTKNLAELDADDEDLWTEDEISEAGGDAEAKDVQDDEANFDPDTFAKWRETYLQATQSEQEEDDDETTPTGTPALDIDDPMDGSASDATPVPESNPPDATDNDNEVNSDDEFADIAVRGSWKFSKERLENIRCCIREVSLPTHVTHLPANLGEPKHGKLKAVQYLTLFSVILPLVLPEMELDDDPERHEAMLQSFCWLIGSTNIVVSFKTSNSAADLFMDYYSDYFASIQALFPDVDVLPTHHNAMHIPDILKNWGPLASQNEFMGERVNGILQKIKTNDHFWDMDYTRLRHFARLGRLLAKKHDKDLQGGALQGLDNILDPVDPKTLQTSTELDAQQLAKFMAKKSRDISMPLYTLILEYLASVGEHKLSFYGTRNAAGTITLPSPDHHSMILPPRGKRCLKFHVDKRTYSCSSSHSATSLIQFYETGMDMEQKRTSTGVITAILQIPLDNILRTFVVVHRHRPVPIQFYTDHPELKAAIVELEPQADGIVIEPRHVITHLSTWKRPADIYHTKKPVLANGRKDLNASGTQPLLNELGRVSENEMMKTTRDNESKSVDGGDLSDDEG